VKYKDVNGDGVINGMDERPIGYRQDSTPIFNYGFNFSFLWKGFDLAFDLAGGALSTWYQEWEQRNPFHDGVTTLSIIWRTLGISQISGMRIVS